MEIFKHPARYKMVVSGRRFGKTYYAVETCLINAAQTENEYGQDLTLRPVYYIGPTYQQAKRDTWRLFKELGGDLIKETHERDQKITMFNGREIWILGADRPDNIRGQGLHYVVMDEYADMKPQVWDEIVAPMLADVKGHALFIGTPKGKNHFYELARLMKNDPEWGIFLYHSIQNPYLDPNEIEAARKRMSTDSFRQEFEASFATGSGHVFKEEWFIEREYEPKEGSYYMAVDPAGFAEAIGATKSKLKRLDEFAIAVAKVNTDGWWIPEIAYGRWGIREASIRILRMAQKYRPLAVGIEKGSLKNAIMPYITDQARRIGVYPNIVELTHGGKKKQERITWALQGRFEHGKISFRPGPYYSHFKDQALDFPNPMAHDDLVDALAYIDQVATNVYIEDYEEEYWEPLDTGIML